MTRTVDSPSMSPRNVSVSWTSTRDGPSATSSNGVGTYVLTSVRPVARSFFLSVIALLPVEPYLHGSSQRSYELASSPGAARWCTALHALQARAPKVAASSDRLDVVFMS